VVPLLVVCDADARMRPSMILWLTGGAVMIGVVAIIALVRRGRPDDLGSVSAAWTNEHISGDRGGDRSTE
jgi:hypothetical protein